MADQETFPGCFELYIAEHAFRDKQEVYTNGSNLISVCRVIRGWEYYTQKMQDKHLQEISARNRLISDMYKLITDFIPDWTTLDIETAQKLNKIHKEVEEFGLE